MDVRTHVNRRYERIHAGAVSRAARYPAPHGIPRDWAHPRPHLRRDWLIPAYICAGTGLTPAHICAGTRPRLSAQAHVRVVGDWHIIAFRGSESGDFGAK